MMKRINTLFVLMLCASIMIGQKGKTNTNSKTIYGLHLKSGWPPKMLKMCGDHIKLKGENLMAAEGYVFSVVEEGYALHLKGTTPKYTKRDQADIIYNDDDLTVIMYCMGCSSPSGCLIGWNGDTPECTYCSGGICNKDFLMIPKSNVSEVQTPGGGY